MSIGREEVSESFSPSTQSLLPLQWQDHPEMGLPGQDQSAAFQELTAFPLLLEQGSGGGRSNLCGRSVRIPV